MFNSEFTTTTNNGNHGVNQWNKFDICWKSFLAKTSLIRDIQKLSIWLYTLRTNIWTKFFIFFELTEIMTQRDKQAKLLKRLKEQNL